MWEKNYFVSQLQGCTITKHNFGTQINFICPFLRKGPGDNLFKS